MDKLTHQIDKIEKYYINQLAIRDQEISNLKNQPCTCGTIPSEIPSDHDFIFADISISKEEEQRLLNQSKH